MMAQLRTALRAYAAEGHPPARVVDRVNRLMWNLGPTAMTTLAYLVLDPAEETLELVTPATRRRWSSSGDAAAHYLPLQGEMALGASPDLDLPLADLPVPDRRDVVLYTDGLVERRGESIDDGLERLRALAERTTTSTPVHAAHRRHGPRTTPPDDVAVIAARLPPLPDDLRTTWPAGRSRSRRASPAAPLAARPRRHRGRDLRHHRRLPGGVRERGRARLRAGRALFEVEASHRTHGSA